MGLLLCVCEREFDMGRGMSGCEKVKCVGNLGNWLVSFSSHSKIHFFTYCFTNLQIHSFTSCFTNLQIHNYIAPHIHCSNKHPIKLH